MELRLADTFLQSLDRLTGSEQKAVKTTVFDLQRNPRNPGARLERIRGAAGQNFWSARASEELRIVVHKIGSTLTLCYVDSHDDAYDWAHRHRLNSDSNTGVASLVELREVAGQFYSRQASNTEELERALDFPWETWRVKPTQRGDKEQAIMDFLRRRIFDPILESTSASEEVKAGVRRTIERMEQYDAAGMIRYYWLCVIGTNRSLNFAGRMRREGFNRFEEVMEEFRLRFDDEFLRRT
jgi:hypothetical protein